MYGICRITHDQIKTVRADIQPRTDLKWQKPLLTQTDACVQCLHSTSMILVQSQDPATPAPRAGEVFFFLVFCLSRGALFANPVVTQHSHTELGGANLLSFRLSIFSGDLRRLPRVRPRHITFFSLSLSSSSLASCRGKKLGTRESVDVSGFFPPFPPFAAYF